MVIIYDYQYDNSDEINARIRLLARKGNANRALGEEEESVLNL